jgi:hypothetical protein
LLLKKYEPRWMLRRAFFQQDKPKYSAPTLLKGRCAAPFGGCFADAIPKGRDTAESAPRCGLLRYVTLGFFSKKKTTSRRAKPSTPDHQKTSSALRFDGTSVLLAKKTFHPRPQKIFDPKNSQLSRTSKPIATSSLSSMGSPATASTRVSTSASTSLRMYAPNCATLGSMAGCRSTCTTMRSVT